MAQVPFNDAGAARQQQARRIFIRRQRELADACRGLSSADLCEILASPPPDYGRWTPEEMLERLGPLPAKPEGRTIRGSSRKADPRQTGTRTDILRRPQSAQPRPAQSSYSSTGSLRLIPRICRAFRAAIARIALRAAIRPEQHADLPCRRCQQAALLVLTGACGRNSRSRPDGIGPFPECPPHRAEGNSRELP